MQCKNCGKEYGDEMNFCPYCGTPKYQAGADQKENVSDGTESTRTGEVQAKSKKWGKNKPKVHKAGIAVLASIALICGIVIFINVTDRSAEQFVEDVQAGNMTDAAKIYQRKLLDHEKRDAEAKRLIETELTDVVAKYHKGEVSVDEAIEKIDAFAQFYYNETFPFKKEIIEAEMKETVDDYFGYRISYEDAMASVGRFSAAYSSVTDSYEAKIQQLHTSQESFIQAEKLMAQGNYAEAEDLYLAVIEEDRDHETAAAKAEECYTRKLEGMLAEAEEIAAGGNYLEAINRLNEQKDLVREEDYSVLEEKAAEYMAKEKEQLFARVDALIGEGNHLQGIDVLKQFQEENGEDSDVEAKIAGTITQYEQYIRDRVFEFVAQRDMESARVLVKESQQQLPDNESFIALEKELEDYYPVALQDVFLFEDGLSKKVQEFPKDIYQNQYTLGIRYDFPSDLFYGDVQEDIYLLNREYQTFTAVIAPSEDWTNNYEASASIIIYGDGTELFKVLVERDSKPVPININVTGVEKLEIVFKRVNRSGYYLLAEPQLYKK